jgi:hypothetical protein
VALIAQVTDSNLQFDGVVGETYTYSIDGRWLGYDRYGLSSYLPSIRIVDNGTVQTQPGNTSGLDVDYVRIAWTRWFLVQPGSPGFPPQFQSISGYTYLDASSAWLDQGFSGATLVGTSGPDTLDLGVATLGTRDASRALDSGFVSLGQGGALTWAANTGVIDDLTYLYGAPLSTYTLQIGIVGPEHFTLDSFDTTSPPFQSDVLWRNDTGQLALWDMANGGAIAGSGFLSIGGTQVTPDASWSIVADSDFSGDGRADLVWRNTSGMTALWTMNGSSITSSSSFTSSGSAVNPDLSWRIAGAGDFDGDGKSDLLWRNTSGSLALWTLNGSTITGSGFVTSGGAPVNPDPNWTVAGVGDFNGDGESDLIWRNTATNEVAAWLMNGSSITGSADVTSSGVSVRPGASWSIAGVGDFNGDGKSDVLWRDSASNSLVVWLMNGTRISGGGAVTVRGNVVSPDSSWHVVEIGDFNGDARADVFWRNDNGTLAEWQLNGNAIMSSFTPNVGGVNVAPDATWHIQSKPTD